MLIIKTTDIDMRFNWIMELTIKGCESVSICMTITIYAMKLQFSYVLSRKFESMSITMLCVKHNQYNIIRFIRLQGWFHV